MSGIGGTREACGNCGEKISEGDVYIYQDRLMCDECAMKAGLSPLQHRGARRDKISERGRYLTVPKP